jgi:IMP dehydrogenase
VEVSLVKLKSTMCNVGVLSVKEFHEKARLSRVSEMTVVEGGTSTVEMLDRLKPQED